MPLMRNIGNLPLTVTGAGRAEPGEAILVPEHLANGLTNPPWQPVEAATHHTESEPDPGPREEE